MNYLRSITILTFLVISLTACEKDYKTPENKTATTTGNIKQKTPKNTSNQDTTQLNNDTNVVQPHLDDYGEEYNPYFINYVIANEVYVKPQPNKTSNKIKSLFFGDQVWVNYDESIKKYKKVFLTKPIVGKPEPTAYYIIESTLVDSYAYKEYETNFALKPFSELHTGAKKLILENRYANSMNFMLTQNSDRAKDVIAYGDYDDDGINDIAVLIDNVERQSSRLLILCTNAATKQPYLAYSNTYVDKLKVKSFSKGAKIFMENNYLEPSPIDGIILHGEDSKGAIIYNKNTQKFETFGQYRNGVQS